MLEEGLSLLSLVVDSGLEIKERLRFGRPLNISFVLDLMALVALKHISTPEVVNEEMEDDGGESPIDNDDDDNGRVNI